MKRTKSHHFICAVALGVLFVLSIACGSSGGSSIANRGGISGTGDPSLLGKPIVVESFELAHESYGLRTKGLFNLNTLAPVFKVKATGFEKDQFKDVILMKFTDVESGQSTTLNNLEDFARFVSVDTDNTFYIYLFKSDTLSLKDTELKPGHEYTYSIEANTGYSFSYDTNIVYPTGSIITRNFTFTYPHQKANSDSMVHVQGAPLSGIDSLTPDFLIHSKYPISSFNQNAPDGKFGIFDKLSVLVNGTNLFKVGGSQYEFSSVSSTAIKIKITNGLTRGAQYQLKIESNGLQMNGRDSVVNVNSADIPSTMFIHTKF
jgi:hypothetical protein